MINSVQIKNIATFNNDGIIMDNLKHINIIYGSNGSGKSTISKVIADAGSFDSSTISWEDGRQLEVMAYNKDFCAKNFLEQMPGVFTLGEAGTETIVEIEKKRKELETILANEKSYKLELDKQTANKESLNKTFCEHAWTDVFKKHEQWFSKSAIGAGTKDKFVEKLKNAYRQDHSNPLPIDELKDKAKVLFGLQPSRIEPYALIDSSILETIEKDSIWGKIIIGKQNVDIAGLISKLSNSDWVSAGVKYIEDGSNICPFCQQHTITTSFRSKINEFFDATYKHDICKIDERNEQYKNAVESLMYSVQKILESQKVQGALPVDNDTLSSIASILKATCDKNFELMYSKHKEPSRIISLAQTSEVIREFNDELIKINGKIKSHNDIVDNFSHEKSILIGNIWKFFAHEYAAAIATYNNDLKGKESAIDNLYRKRETALKEYNEVKKKITELENSVTSVTPTVNEINRLLKGYGFTNFQIQEVEGNKNQYHIVRENGELARATLSEGEATFITFLYYMQLIKGSFNPNGVTTDRVLVIDDPVSSLDSNVLFVVSTLIRDLFTGIHDGKISVKQVILLTHNVYFHKEIAFLDKHCKWRDNIKHFVLRKKNNISSMQDYGKQNPIKSSYELLWTELKSRSQHSCIVMQNVMRRIIENYFLVLGGISPDVILEKFENQEERVICRSLLSWVNAGSHTFSDDLCVEMSDEQLEQNMDIFEQIFKKMGQEAHYNMMMQIDEKEDESFKNKMSPCQQ